MTTDTNNTLALLPDVAAAIKRGQDRVAMEKLAALQARERALAEDERDWEAAWGTITSAVLKEWPYLAPYLEWPEWVEGRWRTGRQKIMARIPGLAPIYIEVACGKGQGQVYRAEVCQDHDTIEIYSHYLSDAFPEYDNFTGEIRETDRVNYFYPRDMDKALAVAAEIGDVLPDLQAQLAERKAAHERAVKEAAERERLAKEHEARRQAEAVLGPADNPLRAAVDRGHTLELAVEHLLALIEAGDALDLAMSKQPDEWHRAMTKDLVLARVEFRAVLAKAIRQYRQAEGEAATEPGEIPEVVIECGECGGTEFEEECILLRCVNCGEKLMEVG